MKPAKLFVIGWVGILAGVVSAVQAQSTVGTVAALQGVLEVQRGRAWAPLASGDDISAGAQLRTAASSRAKILLQDDSVVDLGAASELLIESIDTPALRRPSVLRLSKGKVHAWVSEGYRKARARFEIETPTAVVGVRGTEMIVIYSPDTELTEVIGISDQVEVFGKLAVPSSSVAVGAGAYTQVQKGRFPTATQELDELRLRQFYEGLELRGTGRRDGLNVEHPLLAGRLLAAEDVPATAVATQEPLPAVMEARPGQAPLAMRYSSDVYTNRQPLRQYRLVPPGTRVVPGPSTGGVVVDF